MKRALIRGCLRGVRYAWAAPATVVGLLPAVLACVVGARARVIEGTLEISGGRVERLVGRLPGGCQFCAITLGHVVICIDERTAAAVRAHEQVHVRQYERWGLLFFPLYFGSSLVQYARGRRPYLDNRFEREARAIAGD